MIMKVIAAAAAAAIVLLLPHICGRAVAADHHPHLTVPAIYVFGDSFLDVGNNNYLDGNDTGLKSNYPHYGIDYTGGRPTGRFSNGYVAADFVAKKLGFEESPPAILSVKSPTEEIHGINFASGGSGALDTTRPNVTIPMNAQIEHFRKAVGRLVTTKGSEEAARLWVSSSLFLVSSGGNDLFTHYAAVGPQNASLTDQFVSALTTQLREQLKTLYSLGARKFVVFGVSYIGCSPALRALTPAGGCIEDLNQLSNKFNTAMKKELQLMATSLLGMKFTFADLYNMITSIFKDPSKFGFKNVVSACCGNGRFNGQTSCLPNATYCANRDQYALWDWSHFSQASHKVIVDLAYHGPSAFAQPVNIGTLIGRP